jgi:3-oxoacyl-(acyl-carrier-protein) synthase
VRRVVEALTMQVVVTGLGLISALGRGAAAHLDALTSGRSGLASLTLFDTPGLSVGPVGQVARLDDETSRCAALALMAARDALSGASFGDPGGIFVGTTTGGIFESEQHYLRHRGATGKDDRQLLRHHAAGVAADLLAARLGLSAERHTFSTACSSSANAIGMAAARVAAGLPWALAGGADSLCRLTLSGFHALKLLSADPCRPFDAQRRGLSLGEAAAFVLLEPLERARARGAMPLATVAGWGCTTDAYHVTSPHPEGRGALAAMRAALAEARVSPAEVDYVNAHGTATPANDVAESRALAHLFGVQTPLVSSTKGATGHTLGAAGALEAALCVLFLQEGFAPATVGLKDPDPALAVRHVPAQGLRQPLRTVLSNSFGFGGNNAALVLQRVAS